MKSTHYDVITGYKEEAEWHCLDNILAGRKKGICSKFIQIQAMCVNDDA